MMKRLMAKRTALFCARTLSSWEVPSRTVAKVSLVIIRYVSIAP
jgi:hypothetical protein